MYQCLRGSDCFRRIERGPGARRTVKYACAPLIVFRFERGMMHNPVLEPTANPLRGLSAAEFGRYAAT